jgi:hypothetical protein
MRDIVNADGAVVERARLREGLAKSRRSLVPATIQVAAFPGPRSGACQ